MGRITLSTPRERIHDTMRGLRSHFREALKDQNRHKAFDELFAVWDDETAAAVYQMGGDGVYSAMDLLNLQSAVDNRREILRLKAEYKDLLEQLKFFKAS